MVHGRLCSYSALLGEKKATRRSQVREAGANEQPAKKKVASRTDDCNFNLVIERNNEITTRN